MAKRSPQPVDITVGQNIRIARLAASLSQTTLGERVGVTFQQVQKYEKGANRVGASRMMQIATVLGTTPAALFGMPVKDQPVGYDIVRDLLSTPYGLALAQSYLAIGHNRDRQFVADLAARLAARSADAGKVAPATARARAKRAA